MTKKPKTNRQVRLARNKFTCCDMCPGRMNLIPGKSQNWAETKSLLDSSEIHASFALSYQYSFISMIKGDKICRKVSEESKRH